ncbi:MAG: hypothetical protein ABH870_07165 [bacterium]
MEMLYLLLMGIVMFFACYEAIFVYRRINRWVGKERAICLIKVPVLTMLICMLVCMINCVVDLSVMAGF